MAGKSRISSLSVLRVVPLLCMLLFSIFRKPVFRWIALTALLIWFFAELAHLLSGLARKKTVKKRRTKEKKAGNAETNEGQTHDNSLLLQVNYRITEQLKASYPSIAWLWVNRPEQEEIKRGGTWRIGLQNADPFNFAEIQLRSSGAMEISLMQLVSLSDPVWEPVRDDNELKADELIERYDVRRWYAESGERILCGLVEELNTQGFKQLRINEGGEVVTGPSDNERTVSAIDSFPPKSAWSELCSLVREDDIQASISGSQLAIAW